MSEPDLTLLRARAAEEANRWVIERGAFGDADAIDALALELSAACREPPALCELIAAELRLRSAYIRTMSWAG